MCDFELSDALDGPFDLDVTGFEPSCFNMKDAYDEIFRLEEGLDLVVSHNQKTMKGVANLVLAVNRLKKQQNLSDDELCGIIMDSVVDEQVVETVVNPCTGMKNRLFRRINSGLECTLADTNQKALVCTSEDLKLQAVTVRGGYNDRKVNFKLAQYIPSVIGDSCGGLQWTVVLSIKKSNLHVSCSMKGNNAVLNLEECSKEKLMNIGDEDMERFLFYKRTTELSQVMFESVKCPKWFISTSSDENQPVEMCRQETDLRLTSFRMI